MSRAIEKKLAAGQWQEARRLIESELKKTPDDHWLLDRLSVTYYEEREYGKSLEFIERAFAIAPQCPLVIWDYAGTRDALGQHTKALHLYSQIVNQYPDNVHPDACNEGEQWIESLILDCFYRIGVCFRKLGNILEARWFIEKYLELRRKHPGLKSIYETRDVEKKLRDLVETFPSNSETEGDIVFWTRQAKGILEAV